MSEELNYGTEEFCSTINPFVTFVNTEDPKFVRQEGKLVLQDTLNPVLFEEAKELPSYKKFYTSLFEDEVFRYGLKKIGRWCTVDTLIEWMITKSVKMERDSFIIDSDKAKAYLENFRNTLSLKHASYTIYRRILGLELDMDKIELDEGTSIVRLNEEDLNRQMLRVSVLDIGMPYLDLTRHHGEVRCSLSQNVKKIKSNLLRPSGETKEALLNMTDRVFSALILVKEGMIEVGPYSIKIDTAGNESLMDEEETMISQFMLLVFRNKIKIKEEDLPLLKEAYRRVTEIYLEGGVLLSALKRFILGSRRLNPEDRFIDYVIACESLLLTIGGKPGNTELAYRFAANGSSVLYWVSAGAITRDEGFSFMKGVYDCRSIIVHGGDEKTFKKALEKSEVSDISGLAEKLGEYLRKTILWLARIDINLRPYKEKGGWEKMLWTNPDETGGR